MAIIDRAKTTGTVQAAFLKDQSIGKVLKIRTTDWSAARADVERFLKPAALPTLALWSDAFFLAQLEKIGEGLQ